MVGIFLPALGPISCKGVIVIAIALEDIHHFYHLRKGFRLGYDI